MRFLRIEIVPQSLRGTAIVDVPHQERNLPKGKARRDVFSGNGDDVKGVPSASFPMTVHHKPRQATPARSTSSGKKGKKSSRNRGRKKLHSPGRPKSPKGSRSPKGNKGSGPSKTTPAAVCLVASMLASVSQFCPRRFVVPVQPSALLTRRCVPDSSPWEHVADHRQAALAPCRRGRQKNATYISGGEGGKQM